MKITDFHVDNYRTLESLHLRFPSPYAAICGPNDSGKTNVVRAIRALMKEEDPLEIIQFGDPGQELSVKSDYPKWKTTEPAEREVEFRVGLLVHRHRDAGLFQFLVKQLELDTEASDLAFTVTSKHRSGRQEPIVTVATTDQTYEGIQAQEVLKRVQSSRSILFHNSTGIDTPLPFRRIGGHMRAMSPEHEAVVSSMRRTVDKGLGKLSRRHKEELERLLGRLETKYSVGLSMPPFDFTSIPFRVTLGQKDYAVPLDDWGSGTKNRTLILLTLFRAKQVGEGEASASKVTPIIVVEEPESFLHPAAQAEFGRVLQDLAEEFDVQVVVTTHSPYLLNHRDPGSNILLRRRRHYRQLLETELVDTFGDSWMEPFGLALGLTSDELRPWRDLILGRAPAVLLVEGDTDKEYFELLRQPGHGPNRLEFDGEIVPYNGAGSLQNGVLLRFIRDRLRRMFITFDLDQLEPLSKTLHGLGMERRKDYMPVGRDSAGKRNIEGLLPEGICSAVYQAHTDLVAAATQGSKEEQSQARRKLKAHLLEAFRREATPGEEHFGNFYPLVKIINKALA